VVLLGQKLMKSFPIIIATLFDVPDSSSKGKVGTMMAGAVGGLVAGAHNTYKSAKGAAQTAAKNPYKTKETKAKEAEKDLRDKQKKLAEEKMTELCGSTIDSNTFAADEYIGTNSIRSQKIGTLYRVTGMISFGSIKMGDIAGTVKDNGKVLKPGEIGVKDYVKEIKKKNTDVENADAIISSIEEELNSIAGTINKAISLLESDQQIQYCITGRDLSQINGRDNKRGKNTTVARFPKLLDQYRVMIGMAALRKAQDNYNKKVNEEITNATKNSSADVAQYMCQRIAAAGTTSSSDNEIKEETPLAPPFSISYDVGSGVSTKDLIADGAGTSRKVSRIGEKVGETGTSIDVLVNATFDRASRNCHVCRTISAQSCSRKGGSWFRTRDINCSTDVKDPTCEDIKM
jgi:hypothetical protein